MNYLGNFLKAAVFTSKSNIIFYLHHYYYFFNLYFFINQLLISIFLFLIIIDFIKILSNLIIYYLMIIVNHLFNFSFLFILINNLNLNFINKPLIVKAFYCLCWIFPCHHFFINLFINHFNTKYNLFSQFYYFIKSIDFLYKRNYFKKMVFIFLYP